ncbi:MAG: CHAT domain-containing protein [Anaerolineae bacterium]|nr:CHAT domain-containing protein [Anaerolineae bacterium]
MKTLRLRQTALAENRYRADLTYMADGQAPLNAAAEFDFALSEQDERDLRWYLEDYLQNPHDPAPTIAGRIEARMKAIGEALFHDIFEANSLTTRLWAKISDSLDDLRVEVVATVQDATAIPWELLRDPTTNTVLALSAKAFVRSQDSERTIELPQTAAGEAIRILLVIARPNAGDDVPFRSVAARILKSLSEADRKIYHLDVLRPATFEALGERLRDAKTAGKPYHVVHFDGHGGYGGAGSATPSNALMYSQPGKQGYLVFEGVDEKERWVDGERIGKLLVETDVPLLLLNACQSAYAEAPEQPTTGSAGELHAEVRAFGSLAQQVMDAGVAGVVAMRYSVYVVTAAQFVADLYRVLLSGVSLGEAVTRGRKALSDQPQRKIGLRSIALQDWCVPLIYEAAPIELFPKQAQRPTITIKLTQAAGEQGDNLPRPPAVGFFGRDETLLALDRGFDQHRVALLWALAGSGKTTTAAEFARWYAETGGLGEQYALLFTSFERHKPLARVLDDFADAFKPLLDANNIPWSALEVAVRRDIALQVLAQIPVLWLWDNVEPVAGVPAGAASQWSADEQRDLRDFLYDASRSRARFLLTSRRDENAWLGLLPLRIQMPPMPLYERLELATALAARRGARDFDAEAWLPLLRYTLGNPLTVTVLVDQALTQGLKKQEQVERFVAQLRAGEAEIADVDEAEGRGASLAASLRYGFESSFSADEKAALALLHLFQGLVDVDALRIMGAPDEEWTIEAVKGKTRDDLLPLLERAAGAGLLTNLGGGYYGVHPALPWYFRRLFAAHYPDAAARLRAERAYTAALAELGNYYHRQLNEGNPAVMGALAAEEDNLLAARRLALGHNWQRWILQTMQGLRELYDRSGRGGEWAALVNEIVPLFCDSTTDLPRDGVDEEDWGMVIDYRVRLALEARDLDAAERLQRARIEVDRRRAAPALAGELSAEAGRNLIRTLSVSIFTLGQIQRERGDAACVQAYEEAAALLQRIGDQAAEAMAAFNLGHAYKDIPAIRDLAQAAHWYQRSLELRAPTDTRNRATSLGQLGSVARESFKEARTAGADANEQATHLNEAARRYHQALDLLPSGAVPERAVIHNQLGNIYDDAGQTAQARGHYDAAIRYYEQMGDGYYAARTRYNIGIMYYKQREFETALLYAEAALRGFQASPNAADMVALAQRLVELIQRAMGG